MRRLRGTIVRTYHVSRHNPSRFATPTPPFRCLTSYVAISGSSPGNGIEDARLQVVPLVLSSVLLGLVVFIVLGPDQSAIFVKLMTGVALLSAAHLTAIIVAGSFAWASTLRGTSFETMGLKSGGVLPYS